VTRAETAASKASSEPAARSRRSARIELANAIHDYIELFHNRRDSALGMLSPTEYEELHNTTQWAA
jgi:hypothetical protein